MNCRAIYLHFPLQESLKESEMTLLLELSGRIPLAVRILSQLYKELSEESRTRDYLTSMLQNSATRNVISYAYDKLSDTMKDRLLRLSVMQATRFDINCVVDILQTQEEALSTMSLLTTKQIVEYTLPEDSDKHDDQFGYVYFFHPLVYEILKKKHSDNKHIITAARAHLCRHVFKKFDENVGKQASNFRTAVYDVASKHNALIKTLSEAVVDDFRMPDAVSNAQYRYLKELLTVTVHSPKEKATVFENFSRRFRQSDNFYLYMACKREIVSIRISDGNTKEALDLADQCLRELESLPVAQNEKKDLTAAILYEKGRVLWQRVDPAADCENAHRCFDEALQIYQEIDCEGSWGMEMALVYNAKGNVLYKENFVDEACRYHELAAETARKYTNMEPHPWLSLFEFNVGTVYVAKAHQSLTESEHRRLNYEKALQTFNHCIKTDQDIGSDHHPQFAAKLSFRADVLEKLGRFKEAVDDREEQLTILDQLYPGVHKDKTKAYVLKADTLLKHRAQKSPTGTCYTIIYNVSYEVQTG